MADDPFRSLSAEDIDGFKSVSFPVPPATRRRERPTPVLHQPKVPPAPPIAEAPPVSQHREVSEELPRDAAPLQRDLFLPHISPGARDMWDAGLNVPDFVASLAERQLFRDAVVTLAWILSRREAVRWAWRSARLAHKGDASDAVTMALIATENWLEDGTEENRRRAWISAQEADLGTPAGCAAAAVFWSEGSQSPEGAPPIEPDAALMPRGVAGAVLLAAAWTEPRQQTERFQLLIERGLQGFRESGRGPGQEVEKLST